MRVFKHRPRPRAWREFGKQARHPGLIPFYAMEWVFSYAAFYLSRWSFLEVLEYVGSLSILVAVIFWFSEAGERTQQRHYQAWQVINTAQGQSGSGGRIEALEDLNGDGVMLTGINLSDAYLEGVKLEKAHLWRARLHNADLRAAHLGGAALFQAVFSGANVRGADLRDADMEEAEFSVSDATGADVTGASFKGADFRGASLLGIVGWQAVRSYEGAKVGGMESAPPGFVEWAVKHGAVEERAGTGP